MKSDRRLVLAMLGCAALPALPATAAPQTAEAFRREVLAILADSFPDQHFEAGAGPDEIRSKDHRLGLANLQATMAGLTGDKRRIEIIKWFSVILRDIDDKLPSTNWAAAQPLLRPKLVQRSYLQNSLALVSRPFEADLAVAEAIDLGRRDEYVLAHMLKAWGVDERAVHDRAIANLETMSPDIDLAPGKARDGSGLFVAVHKGDAYDACRILLPAFRGRLMDVLGVPAYAGVPNRDFMVAWSKGFSAQEQFIEQIGKDSLSQPYPLSASIFRLDRDGVRVATPEDLSQR